MSKLVPPQVKRHVVERSKGSIIMYGVLALAISIIIVVISSLVGVGSQIKPPLLSITGMSTFAIFYLMAQFVERITEPFTNIKTAFGEDQKQKLNVLKNVNQQKKLLALEKTGTREELVDELNKPDEQQNEQKLLQANQDGRTIAIWCLASAIGIILCYYTVGLFQMVGVTFVAWSHLVDAILSGIIVGAGTKPLHDLIGFIQDKSS